MWREPPLRPCASEVRPHEELGQGWALPVGCAGALSLHRASPAPGTLGGQCRLAACRLKLRGARKRGHNRGSAVTSREAREASKRCKLGKDVRCAQQLSLPQCVLKGGCQGGSGVFNMPSHFLLGNVGEFHGE